LLAPLASKNVRPGPGTKALIVLAESRMVRGDFAGARSAASQAAATAAKSPNRADYGLPAELIQARVEIAAGNTVNGGPRLNALLTEARKLQNVPHQFAARFALGELPARTGKRREALATALELQRDAGKLGFGAIQQAAGRVPEMLNGQLAEAAPR
jgi:ATP/maltotriose-dependent transcriptional regulator MalT